MWLKLRHVFTIHIFLLIQFQFNAGGLDVSLTSSNVSIRIYLLLVFYDIYIDALNVNLGHLADAFIQKRLSVHTHNHTLMVESPRKATPTTSSSGAVRVKCLAQGHLVAPLGGDGDRTSKSTPPPLELV